jgi:hypothetical protein
VESYELLDGSRPAGRSRSSERVGGEGRRIDFDAVLGAPEPEVALAGSVQLDGDLAWQALVVERSGGTLRLARDGDLELEIEGVPALYGVTTRRLVSAGLVPSQRRTVAVLRVARDLSTRRYEARYVWLGGQLWVYDGARTSLRLAVRLGDGVVRSVDGLAELER